MRIAIVMFKRYLDIETGKVTDEDAPHEIKESNHEEEPAENLKLGFQSERSEQ